MAAPEKASRSLSSLLGTVVAQRRRESGISQEEFAFRAGLHRTSISLIERGCKSPTLDTLDQIAKALGVSPAVLLADAERLTHRPSRKA